jgi:hypothetical protein
MSGMSRCLSRRTAGLIAAVAALALGLIAAPVALASGDTITPTAGQPFSGVVDASPSCSATAPGTTATIDWGDTTPTSPGTIDPRSGAVSGSHLYTTAGVFFGSVTFTGGSNCDGIVDDFTARVTPPASFTQCPAVDRDSSCQFLIVATSGGTTIQVDSNQTAYDDGGDDALIGVQNNSSSPISSIPISADPGLFGFEEDGLCDPGSPPVPSGCVPVPGSSGTCGNGAVCAFPAPPGQPAGYVEPGALSGSTQNGYEGPTSFFTNISSDASSGVVHFSPAIPPGGSTYFSLEEPPVGTLNAGSSPGSVGLTAPPTVTATSAAFTGIVNPNGAATTAQFQFNLDGKYGKLAAITRSTPTQNVGGDFADHVVTATVGGLAPNAVYHVRLVATNKNGQTVGTDVTFKTKSAAAPGAPTLGRTFNVAPVRGVVLVKLHGFFQPITQLRQFHNNALFDALGGTLRLITAAGGHPATDAAAKGKKHKGKVKTQSGTFSGAVFKIKQAHNGLATLTLVENAFKGAPSFKKCGGKASDVTASAASSRTLQLLRSSARGRFATRGKYAAATVRGTRWTTADRCNGTQVHVAAGSVAVTDLVRHKTVVLHGGQSYLAKKP